MRPLVLAVALLAVPAVAVPRDFPFTWTSRTSAAGQNSLEAWFTPRLVRADDFLQLDTRVVWTYGVARTLESQLSLDTDFQRTDRSEGLEARVTSLWRWTTWREGTPFAVGGLGRVSLGLDHFEAEARLFTDLHLERVVLALNLSASRALFWNDREGIDTRLEESIAVKYAVSSAVTVGLEARAKSAWKLREYQGTAIYVGPAMTFSHPKFWLTIGGYAQVAADRANADRELEEPNELRDNERYVFRVAFGFET